MNKKDVSNDTFDQLVSALKEFEKAKTKLSEARDNVAIVGEEIKGLLDSFGVEIDDEIANIMA
jgi:hypothetical protein